MEIVDYAKIAKERGYKGEFRMKVVKSKVPARPEQLCLVPLYPGDKIKIEQMFKLDMDHRVIAYPISAWVGTIGKDYRVALRLNEAGTAFAVFPLDYRYLRDEWKVDSEQFAFKNDFSLVFHRKDGALWSSVHPRTGQIILAFTHSREGKELWKVESDDGKTSSEYAPGSLTISRSIVSTILAAGPEKVIRGNRTKLLTAQEEEKRPPEWEIYMHEAVLPLGKHFVPITRLVGNFLELSENEEKQLIANLRSFRRLSYKTTHPDVIGQTELSDDEKRRQDDRFKDIDITLKWAEEWLKGRFAFVRGRRSVDEALYAAMGKTPPPIKLGEPTFPQRYRLPRNIESGNPLAFREVDEVLAIFFPTKPGKKVMANPTASKPAEKPAPATNRASVKKNGKLAPPTTNHHSKLKLVDMIDKETAKDLTALAEQLADDDGRKKPKPRTRKKSQE